MQANLLSWSYTWLRSVASRRLAINGGERAASPIAFSALTLVLSACGESSARTTKPIHTASGAHSTSASLHGALMASSPLSVGSVTSAVPSRVESEVARAVVAFARSLDATVDVGTDLARVVESDRTQGACADYKKALGDAPEPLPAQLRSESFVRTMLLCGKDTFFRLGVESKAAFPTAIVRTLLKMFPSETGPAFSRLGLIPNPFDKEFPVGLATLPGNPWGAAGGVVGKPMTVTCAACHFARMPDGRYAVGMPNDELQMGKLNALMVFPAWLGDKDKDDTALWPSSIQAYFKGLDAIARKDMSGHRALLDSMRLVGMTGATQLVFGALGIIRPTPAELDSYLYARSGVSYASSPLLPATKRVAGELKSVPYYLSSPTLWDLENFPGQVARKETRPLSAFIPTDALEDFARAAMVFQTGDDAHATRAEVAPLVLYLRTLTRPPLSNISGDDALAARGKNLFAQKCVSCHAGSRGEGLEPLSAETVGTPRVLIDPFVGYEPPHETSKKTYAAYVRALGPIQPRTGIFARPLLGLATRKRLFTNGSVDSIADVFCLGAQTRSLTLDVDNPLTQGIHSDLCTSLDAEEKRALMDHLERL